MYKSSASRKRVAALRGRITEFDYMCSGNLRRRYAVCGTPNCRCKGRPPQPHGPYYYWSRLLDGKVVQRVLSPKQVEIVARGIKNYRKVRELLRRWQEETVREIEIQRDAKR